ncbi:MAG TPA: hypothetical protein VGS07_06570 [Thermoanaerobaculia bacterium]|jgi:hypothetical protein|nr:hypothetical protein [Thermoanaerobaculia bacterium]
MGGFVFGENGKGHFGSLTFDKVRNDQTLGFRYLEGDSGAYQAGLEVWQQPNLPLDIVASHWEAARRIPDEAARKAAMQALIDKDEATKQRLFLGKWRDNSAVLVMSDIKGRPRIRMQVAPDGMPKLEFLDDAGKVLYSLPNSSGASKPLAG